ncbi:MAG: MAPEG family protein [Kangiellaceae bacterium]
MEYVQLIAALAILQFFFFAAMVGKARVKFGIKAPAITGDEGFERMYRVQMNTLEVLVMFLPALFLAGIYWSGLLVSALGGIYIIGRFLYWRAYVTEPSSRGLGFILSIIPSLILIILAIVGAISSLIGFSF